MGLLDGLLGSLGGGSVTQMIEQQAAGAIAAKMGIDPSMAQMAIGALMQQHNEPNDTVQAAAQQTGMSGDMMSQVLSHIGGEGALGQLVGAAQQQAGSGGLGSLLGGLMGGQKS